MQLHYFTSFSWKRLILAVVTILIASLLRIWPLQSLDSTLAWLTFYPAVMIISVYGGLWAGLLSTFLSCLIVNNFWFLFVPKPFINHHSDLIGMGVFSLTGALISSISEAMRQANIRAIEAEKRANLLSLSKSEEKYKLTIDNLMEGCQILDFNWRYLYINEAAEKHNRRSGSELIGEIYMEMWPGIESTEVFNALQKCMNDRTSHVMENEFIYPDGLKAWFDLSIQPVPEGVFILSIDITERKVAEFEQRESEEKYRLISENSDDWIYWVTPDGQMHYVSPACQRVTGYSPEEFFSHPKLIQEIIYTTDKEVVSQHIQTLTIENTSHILEFRILSKDGEIQWISHSCSPIFDANGEFLGRLATNRKITDRKRKEEQLYESEFRFNKLYENGPFGMVMVDREFKFKKANLSFCEIMGYNESEIQKLTFKDITHADDIAKDLINIQKLNRKKLTVYKTEKRYIRKDGQEIWGSLTVTTNYDSEGQLLYYLGILEDITERKLAAEALQESGLRLELALNSSHSGVWDWDLATNKIVWSSQMYDLFGVDKNITEASFDTWRTVLHPDDKEQAELRIADAIKTHTSLLNEYRVILPDGNIRWINATGEAIYDSGGQPLRMIGICKNITEQKLAAEKIREKDQEFRKLSANVPDMIYQFTRRTDGTYYVPIASEGIRNIFGCTPEEVLEDFAPIGRVIYPEDTERVIRDIEYSAQNLTYFTSEFRVQIPGREIQWIYSNSTPERLPDGSVTWYGFNTNITNRKNSEETLKLSEKRYRELFENMNAGFVLFEVVRNEQKVSVDLKIIDANATFENTTGIKLRKSLGKNLTQILPGIETDAADWIGTYSKVALSGKSIQFEQGSELLGAFFAVSAFQPSPDHCAVTFIDISARKKAEEDIKKLNEELEDRVTERTNQLLDSNKELESFAYSVSHDLRAPLRHVIGFSEKLESELKERNDPEIIRLTGKIKSSASKMSILIDELLTYSRLGRTDLKTVKLSFNTLIDNIINDAADITRDRKIEWEINQLPVVSADPTLIKLVLQNLILNSIKFTGKNKKAVIKIDYEEKNKKEYTFYIKDNGAGFKMEYVNKLFGVFQRLHSTEEFEGTGIGLATVRRIIKRHNGSVWAEGVENVGATFFFTLPK